MRLHSVKNDVSKYRYIDDNGNVLNIYIDDLAYNQGRVIVIYNNSTYERYFDGAGGGIYNFISNMTLDSFVSCFNVNSKHTRYLENALKPIWKVFVEDIMN